MSAKFDPQEHLIKVKGGQQYLEVRWRLIWLREVHPDASVEVELTHLDLDGKMAVARATVTLPNGTKATEIGSETEKDFPAGWVEKAATKAVGRALAALGFGTQFALELDEGDDERPADSPVTGQAGRAQSAPTSVAPAAVKPATTSAAPRPAGKAVTAPVPQTAPPSPSAARPTPRADGEEWPRSAAEWSREQLWQRIQEGAGAELKTGKDWKELARTHAYREPASALEMTPQWLLGLYQAMRAHLWAEAIAGATTEQAVTDLVSEALGERDRRQITAQQYGELSQAAEARKAELSAPLLAGGQGRAQVAS